MLGNFGIGKLFQVAGVALVASTLLRGANMLTGKDKRHEIAPSP
jgi:hypothetical protein